MEIRELEGMSSSKLLELSGEVWQMAMEKKLLEQLETKLPEIEKRIEEAHTSYCLSQLASEKARIETLLNQEARLKDERDSLQKQLAECCEKQRRLEDEKAQQDKQLRELRAEAAEHARQRKGYLLACQKEVGKILPFIRTGTYEAYVASLYSRDSITIIYDNMRSECGRGDAGKLELYQQLIDEYIEISHRITGKDALQLQKVEIGKLFDSTRFDKTFESPETGKISNVIYYGLEWDGAVFENCRSLVEVE